MALQVAKLIEDGEELIGGFDLLDTDGRGVGAWFEQPWTGDRGCEGPQVVVGEDRGELRNCYTGVAGTDTHGEFVAEEASGGFAHAWETHVFAEECGDFQVELVQSDDAFDLLLAGKVADGVEDLLRGKALGHGDEAGE